ncbi:MAG: EAL domain-containing protein [Lachnospira sp.]|nr:EAL domain-containing protein [Lachnospira sp.]
MEDGGFALSAAEKQLAEDLPNAVGIYQYLQGKIIPVFFSEQFVRLFGYESREQAMACMSRDPFLHVHPDDIARISDCSHRFARGDAGYDVVYRRRSGRQREYHIIHAIGRSVRKRGARLAYVSYTDESKIFNLDQESQMLLSESFFQDTSLEKELHQDQFDELTGLPMIERFFQCAPDGIRRLQQRGKSCAVLWIEYSGLKEYEILHGFEKGTELIRGLARLIRDAFGAGSTARFNSDCFVAYADADNLEDTLNHLFLDAANLNHGNSRPVAAGICQMDEEGISLAAAIDRARLACASLGRPMHSSCIWFDRQILARAQMRQYVLQNYQRAMDEGWIQVYYQPVIRAITGTLCGAEALCRWNDPTHGMLLPGDFIPILEEEGLISKLDLYMIEQICRDGRKLMDSGLYRVVPVSVNLSRKDFRKADLVDQIESIAGRYRIPRELLNIEITESAFINHPEKLSKYIKSFHELGYQVWMDDFGTAYSSLGALKNLEFDLLKIDMSFLSCPNKKTRAILTSIVDMAKQIGVRTLAEGVETGEQYQFLKQIGCEKVQGYYFGHPMDKDTFRKQYHDNTEIEELRWRNYYDAVSAIDFQTDRPLCVIEDDGVTFRSLYTNDSYEAVLRQDQVDGIDACLKEINADNNPLHTIHRRYADEQLRKSDGPQVLTYPSGDHLMKLTGTVIAHNEDHYVYAMHIRYMHLNEASEDQQRAFYIQYLYYLCSEIAVIDLKEQTLHGLKSSDSTLPIGNGRKSVDLIQAVNVYADKFVYAPDQQRYHSFYDIRTLREKYLQNSGEELTGFFRIRTAVPGYHWMIHMLMPIPHSDFRKYLAVTIPTGLDLDSLYKLLLDTRSPGLKFVEAASSSKEEITPELLWKNLEMYAGVMYFWKDRERRFLGASRSFLDFYGFQSLDEILGKTDEEMHWHVLPDAFRTDERKVLEQGKRVILAKGKCIARGKPHNIVASKMPVYRDGKIVGLMGMFFDADPLMKSAEEICASASLDRATGLLNTKGFADNLRDYLESLWTDNIEFSILYVKFPEYTPFAERYGEKAGRVLLRAIADMLREIFNNEAVIGRQAGSAFAILIQDTDPHHTARICSRIKEAAGRLRKAGEWPCALTADIRISNMNQQNASQEIYIKNLQRMWAGFAHSDPKA